MSTLTVEELSKYSEPKSKCERWIRVGMDTGGIAAGAQEVYDALIEARDKSGVEVEIGKTGSLGYAFADPVVVVGCTDCPEIVYGAMDRETASEIVDKHCLNHTMLDDRVMAMRNRSTELQPVIAANLPRHGRNPRLVAGNKGRVSVPATSPAITWCSISWIGT